MGGTNDEDDEKSQDSKPLLIQDGQTCMFAPSDYQPIYAKTGKDTSSVSKAKATPSKTSQSKTNTASSKSEIKPDSALSENMTRNSQNGKTQTAQKPKSSSSKKSTKSTKSHSSKADKSTDSKKKSKSKQSTHSHSSKSKSKKPSSKVAVDTPPKDALKTKTEPKEKTKAGGSEAAKAPALDDGPTALIAPSDYVHIYKEGDNAKSSKKK